MKKILLSVVLGAAVLVLAFYALNSYIYNEKQEPNPEPVEQSQQDDNSTEDADFRSQFPMYPGAEVKSFIKSDTADAQTASLSLSTTDSISQVNEWYRGAMAQNGWSIQSDRNVGGYTILQAENGPLYTSMQAARGEGNEIVISQQIKRQK